MTAVLALRSYVDRELKMRSIKNKIKPSDLRKQAEALITEGRMPSLDAVLTAVAEAREKFLPLILATRNDGNRFCDSAER